MTRRDHVPDCGVPLGKHLVSNGNGALRWGPYACGKPATVRGDDGRLRCVQHDRMNRGLPGKWSRTA